MIENPKYWEKHYCGTEVENKIARNYSYSDRIRYYWSNKKVVLLLDRLISNLNQIEIPDTLISQYLPVQYSLIMENKIKKDPESLILSKITEVLNIYNSACGGSIEK